MTATQRQFDLRLSAARPLVPIEAVVVLADRDEDDILNLIELGLLPFAWNIASPGAERREIRIWHQCVVDYLRSDYRKITSGQTTLAAAIHAILPRPTITPIGRKRFETIRGTEVARRFCCSQWLVAHLITTGELQVLDMAIGPKTSPYILHASVVDFLTRRSLRPVLPGKTLNET